MSRRRGARCAASNARMRPCCLLGRKRHLIVRLRTRGAGGPPRHAQSAPITPQTRARARPRSRVHPLAKLQQLRGLLGAACVEHVALERLRACVRRPPQRSRQRAAQATGVSGAFGEHSGALRATARAKRSGSGMQRRAWAAQPAARPHRARARRLAAQAEGLVAAHAALLRGAVVVEVYEVNAPGGLRARARGRRRRRRPREAARRSHAFEGSGANAAAAACRRDAPNAPSWGRITRSTERFPPSGAGMAGRLQSSEQRATRPAAAPSPSLVASCTRCASLQRFSS
jgi:hypothetical protein